MIVKTIMNDFFKIRTFLILWIFAFTFSNKSVSAQGVDDKQVILSVGDVTITKYEFEKNLKIFKSEFLERKNFSPSGTDIEKWVQGFINRAYFLADAYQKGLDTLDYVKKRLTGMEHLVICEHGGLLDQKMSNDNGSLSTSEVENTLELASKRIVVEYLRFKSYDQAVDFMGRLEIKKVKKFDKAVAENFKIHRAVYETDTLMWPFALFEDRNLRLISNFKLHEVTPVLALADGYYVMYVKDFQTLSKSKTNELRKNVIDFLTLKKIGQIRKEYQKEVDDKAKMEINKKALLQLSQFAKTQGPLREFNKTLLSNLLAAPVFSYNFDGKSTVVSVDKFIDYYNYLPLKHEIMGSGDLVYYMKSMVFDSYAYEYARKEGLTKETRFLLDKENYKNEIVYYLYKKDILEKGIRVSDTEVRSRYDLEKSKFREPVEVNISVFYFKNENDALMGMFKIREGDTDSVGLQGLEHIEEDRSIGYTSDFLPDSIKTLIFDFKVNEVLRPIFMNGKYIVIVKESELGNRIKSLDEVKKRLIEEIREEKLRRKEIAFLSRLKTFYPIKNEVDYKKCLSMAN